MTHRDVAEGKALRRQEGRQLGLLHHPRAVAQLRLLCRYALVPLRLWYHMR